MSKIVGTVDKVKCDKPGAIWVDNTRYGAFDPKVAGLTEDMEGKTVELYFTEKGEYKNVKGRVKVLATEAEAAPAASYGPGTTKSYSGGGGYRKSSFPIDAEDGQIAIIRQNAITNANALIANLITSKVKVFGDEDPVDVLVNFAQQIANYTSGHADLEEVKKMADSFDPES